MIRTLILSTSCLALAIPAAATIQILIREWGRSRAPVEPAAAVD